MASPCARNTAALCILVACTAADREAPTSAAPAPPVAPALTRTDGAAAEAAEPAPPPPEPPAPPPPEPPEAASDPPEDVFVRLARWRPDLESACAARPRLACTRTGDLDGDGRPDEVALVRPRGGEQIGLAIAWGRGGGDVLGAGERGRVWRETHDESTRTAAVPTDFSWLTRWDVWLADGPPGKRRGLRDPRGRRFTLAGVIGDGLLLDGGDSAAVAYWDGQRWRLEYLGF